MRISIDSTEPLEGVVRVIEAVYEVTLTVATINEAAPTAPDPVLQRRGGRRTPSGKTSRARSTGQGRSATQRAKVSNEELRSWARENGHPVSDRGRIPAAVVAAYHEV